MIDFGLTSIDFTHIGVPVDHAGDAMASAKLGQVPGPEGGTTNLHISTPNNGNVFEDTIYDKNLWTAAPHPSDNDKVCGWVHDMAASEPKSVCDQWSKDDWNDWANHYEDQGFILAVPRLRYLLYISYMPFAATRMQRPQVWRKLSRAAHSVRPERPGRRKRRGGPAES